LAGFGSMVIALALGAQLYPINELLPVLVPLDVLVTGYMVTRHRQHIAFRFLLTRVIPIMVVGFGAGIWLSLSGVLGGDLLKLCFGVMVVVLASLELAKQILPRRTHRPMSLPAHVITVVGAGVVHGIYATGGPLLVYAVGRSELAKSAFRSTLAAVWLTLNTTLAVTFLLSGRLDATAGRRFAILIPVLVVAIFLGEWGHQRIRERPFRIFVFSLLLLAGSMILVRA
jgi:uncharacterized membrane protein YfcA